MGFGTIWNHRKMVVSKKWWYPQFSSIWNIFSEGLPNHQPEIVFEHLWAMNSARSQDVSCRWFFVAPGGSARLSGDHVALRHPRAGAAGESAQSAAIRDGGDVSWRVKDRGEPSGTSQHYIDVKICEIDLDMGGFSGKPTFDSWILKMCVFLMFPMWEIHYLIDSHGRDGPFNFSSMIYLLDPFKTGYVL